MKTAQTTAASRSVRRAGMTLVEVVLAVAILGVSLAVLLTGASRCLAIMALAKNYQKAQWTLGRGEVAYPLVVTGDLEEVTVSVEEFENGFTFERMVEEEDEEEDDLWIVTTRVSWSDKGHDVHDDVVQYIYYDEQEAE